MPKNYLESVGDVQEQERHATEIELSKHDINTIKRKHWDLKDGKIITRDNKIVVSYTKFFVSANPPRHTGEEIKPATRSKVFTLKSRSKSCLSLPDCVDSTQKSITDHKKSQMFM